ncbi:MAG: hypothetical protein LQ350_005769 [Teloschistes chrysophthalmus]|nr:MAG: hypothetical protein LQ350_005769 [Niorma chrysophthalma]
MVGEKLKKKRSAPVDVILSRICKAEAKCDAKLRQGPGSHGPRELFFPPTDGNNNLIKFLPSNLHVSKSSSRGVPCSSANIGPGFDVAGVALTRFLELQVQVDPSSSQTATLNCVISYQGEGADSGHIDLSPDRNLLTRVALYVLRCHDQHEFPAQTVIHIKNDIPLGRGLGSSGAAVVAGVILGNEVGKLGLSKDRMLDFCLMIERHPDNVAAALYGEVITAKARNVLPAQYSRADVVFNMQRIAILTHALGQSPPDPELIYSGMQDAIHQPYRKELIPGLTEILLSVKPKTHPGLLGICLSGAGPTILALATDNFEHIAQEIIKKFAEANVRCQWSLLEPARDGATVTR